MRPHSRPALLALLTIAAVPTVARAGAPVDLRLPAPAVVDASPATRLELEHRAHDAKVLRNAGIVTTSIGIVVNLVGVGVMVSNLCFGDNGCPGKSGTAALVGAGMIGVGHGAIFAGIPMWAVGGTRLKHARAELGVSASGLVGRF